MDNWKGIRLNVVENMDNPVELYNLTEDPGEEYNLAGQYPEVTQEIIRLMSEAHTTSELFTYK